MTSREALALARKVIEFAETQDWALDYIDKWLGLESGLLLTIDGPSEERRAELAAAVGMDWTRFIEVLPSLIALLRALMGK